MSGYGESGPYVNRPGQDLVLQAMSGAMLSAGRAGEAPTPAGQYLVDAITAYTAFEGALAALFHRERTGEGQLVQVNMLDAIATIQMQELSVFTVGHKEQKRSAEPHAHVFIRAPYGAFATSDGYIVIAFPSLKKLGAVIGEDSFLDMDDEVDTWTRRDEIFAKTQGTAEGQDLRRMAAAVLAPPTSGRAGLRLQGTRRRRADQAQRHFRRVRSSDGRAREDSGLPDQILQDSVDGRPRGAAGWRAHERGPR